MTSLAYGPCPITSLIPWKKDIGSDLRRQESRGRKQKKEMNKLHLLEYISVVFIFNEILLP